MVVAAFSPKNQKMKNSLSVSWRQERQTTVHSYQDMLLVGENACTTEEGRNANKSQEQRNEQRNASHRGQNSAILLMKVQKLATINTLIGDVYRSGDTERREGRKWGGWGGRRWSSFWSEAVSSRLKETRAGSVSGIGVN